MPPQYAHDPATARDTPPMLEHSDRACLDTDPNIFYPNEGNRDAAKPAIKICRRCPITQECLQWALDTRQAFGVWGGATAHERAAILRKREKHHDRM